MFLYAAAWNYIENKIKKKKKQEKTPEIEPGGGGRKNNIFFSARDSWNFFFSFSHWRWNDTNEK